MNQAQLGFDQALSSSAKASLTVAANDRQAELRPVQQSRVTQLHLPGNTTACRYLLPGMLKELSASLDNRWLCWVAAQPVKQLLCNGPRRDIQLGRVLQVVSREPHPELLRLALQALANGRSHTVVVLLDYQPSKADLSMLENAAAAGACECVVLLEV